MDKLLLRSACVQQLEADLALLTQAALTSRDEATHEESRAENQYDMHAQEAAYLAEGQARMVAELHETLSHYRTLDVGPFAPGSPIAVGALVRLRPAAGQTRTYFIGPRAGGMEVRIEDETVLVVTPASPLGRQLVGHRAGNTLLIPGRTGSIKHEILSVD
jgi:transcription elongation GreA/GreB family factor